MQRQLYLRAVTGTPGKHRNVALALHDPWSQLSTAAGAPSVGRKNIDRGQSLTVAILRSLVA